MHLQALVQIESILEAFISETKVFLDQRIEGELRLKRLIRLRIDHIEEINLVKLIRVWNLFNLALGKISLIQRMDLYKVNFLVSGPLANVHLTGQMEEFLPLHDSFLRRAVICTNQTIDCSDLILTQQD